MQSAAIRLVWLAMAVCGPSAARAEDGYDLWLRYRPVEAPWLERYRRSIREIVPPPAASNAALGELKRAIPGLLGTTPAIVAKAARDGALVLGTPRSSAAI